MKTNKIQAYDFGTDKTWTFSSDYRFGKNPKHMHAGSPFFTDETAFDEWDSLENAVEGDDVFIEWFYDRFYAIDTETNQFVPGPTVWRKAKILEKKTPRSKATHDT